MLTGAQARSEPLRIALVIANAQVKVGDFGVSRFTNTDVTTTTFVTVGTPAYMPPEQCRGEAVDGRSDLFAASTTLFEMLAGQRPFSGRNATEVSNRIQNERLPLLPAELRAAVPRPQLALDRATNKRTVSTAPPTWPRPCARCWAASATTPHVFRRLRRPHSPSMRRRSRLSYRLEWPTRRSTLICCVR